MPAAEFPRCAVCRVTIRVGENVAFREDGRVHHTICADVICPVCSRSILPSSPIRRDGEQMVHGNCWPKWCRSAGVRMDNGKVSP